MSAQSMNSVPVTTFIVNGSWLRLCPNISASSGETSVIKETRVADKCVSK